MLAPHLLEQEAVRCPACERIFKPSDAKADGHAVRALTPSESLRAVLNTMAKGPKSG
jgi:hypothetical protein